MTRSIRPIFERLEDRQLMSIVPMVGDVRSYDGTGNNLSHADWGSAGQSLLRLASAAYTDNVAAPPGGDRPSARAISNGVSAHGADPIPSANHLAAYAYLWGQFIDHDLDLTNSATPAEAFNVAVPTGDPYFDPNSTGTQTIGLTRSKYAAGTGVTTPRQQVSDITAFLDGSMVYGSDSVRAAALRAGVGGKLATSAGNLLPFNTAGLDNATLGGPASNYFLAGDVRANENIELTSLQTLFVREHNRRADQIAKANPAFTDEQIFQAARRLVVAEIQMITYNEFLPALVGQKALKPYAGYKANVNPGISNEFSTAAFRLGHSMLPDDVDFLDNNGNDVREALPLAQAFFNPAVVKETGVDPILKYLASSNSEEIDTKVVDGLRNFLFGQPGSGGFDLVSLNIQRGRDHGLADYNSTRAAVGLPKVTTFAQITSDVTLQGELKALYGTVDNIDLWVGGLAEDHVAGSNLGATFQRIVVDQFTRTRDGDRYWYQKSLSAKEMKAVGGIHLADIIKANTGVQNIQPNVFVFNVSVTGRLFDDRNGDKKPQSVEPGLAGRKIELLDDAGTVLQSVTTDARGMYNFSGIGLGTFHVKADTPSGWKSSDLFTGDIIATRGQAFDHVDFAQQKISANPTPTPPPPPTNTQPPKGPPPQGPMQPPPPPPRSAPQSIMSSLDAMKQDPTKLPGLGT